ncbi:erythromycin esterase family protein [Xylophilus sp.]|uniref:erythromycin esterase family protein n=1 Tax=Xylophilus sp. TaxID=2653893 RepID=UPI0013B96C6E|nr:erythromycin esterase family protein [Xylophilus sp.]KAF1050030.1 MAG: hypothetical protein GAK38_00054 [Xylophilus sp.]
MTLTLPGVPGAGSATDDAEALAAIARHGRPLAAPEDALDALAARIGGAGTRFALLGEASHGTHEFYALRADLTRRLIEDGALDAVAIEGDWPDAWRVNRYVRGLGGDTSATAALGGFERFPTWMWRNTVVLEFVEWLRAFNAARPPGTRVGFYGLDLYSLFGFIAAVLRYLDRSDPQAAARARDRYACFDRFRDDSHAYGQAAAYGWLDPHCEDAVVAQLVELQRQGEGAPAAGEDDPDAHFQAAQNARLVRNAERYYRSMFRGRVSSWNLRDGHMAETLEALDGHLRQRLGRPPRFAVWAHNSHLGDARATEMGTGQGELNLGQLVRERHDGEAFALGFSTYTGHVTAASAWDAPGATERVRPGLPDSWEALLHEALRRQGGAPALWLPLRDAPALAEALAEARLQRAIGVVYAPQTERWSHYYHARLPAQFDALWHIDATHALQPLADPPGAQPAGASPEPPATFPEAV